MRDLTVKTLHAIVGGRLRMATLAPRHGEATSVRRIVTDSRAARPQDTFWGLAGTRCDGAAFADDAYSRGATGAVVGGKYVQPWPGCWSLEVPNAQTALEQLARWNRRRMSGRVVGVTGSVGKTTTRQMIRAALSTRLSGTSSPENYNNHVGVPLSMLAIEPDHAFAVLELAASAEGEIATLAALCQPQVGVITRIGDAHLGGFGSIEAVGRAKAELLAALPPDGHAVLDGDDPHLRKLAAGKKAKLTWFGRALENDLVATRVECRQGRLMFCVDGVPMSVPVWGRHYLTPALAAVAVARLFGIEDAQIARGLADFQPPPMRCQITKVGGATIINDTYNASPVAMRAALELLRDFEAPGRRIVICGDMRELGEAAVRLHRNLGDQIVTVCGADLLVACGEYAHEVAHGACAAGMPAEAAFACTRPEDLLVEWSEMLREGDVVLIKGSRAMGMERIVDALQSRETACAA